MFIWANDFHAIFWVAVIPAVLSILLLGFGLQEPKSAIAHKRSNPLKRENLKKLSAAYWWVVAIGSIFTLARFQRSLSGAARPADGDPALYHPAGDGGDEPGLQPHGLPVR